jgi:hypothetical protein
MHYQHHVFACESQAERVPWVGRALEVVLAHRFKSGKINASYYLASVPPA